MTKKILTLMLALTFCLTLPVNAANIIVVTGTRDIDADGIQDDQGTIDWLVAEGHNVDAQIDNWVELDADKIAALDAADLIIVSRASSSGNYDDGDEPTQWNAIDTPLIQMNAYLTRSSRWLWVNSTSILSLDSPIMQAVLPDNPIFDGVAIDADNIILAVDGTVGSGQTSFVVPDDLGNGTLIAQSIDGLPWIVEFEAGVEFYAGAGQAPAAKRVIFNAGTQEVDVTPQGAHNLTADGEQILRNMIANLVPAPFEGVNINFQQTGGDVPEGYLPDGGEEFADRGNGFSYGWNMNSTGGARNRNSDNADDERYDTLNHLEKGEHRIWEIELPNGDYDVFMVSGDPDNTDQINNMDVEGAVLLDPDGEDNFDEYTLTVRVIDGRLTIQMADGASNAKISFVDIALPAPGPAGPVAGDIAISTQAGWFGQDAADREMQEIVDNVTAVSVEQFAADQQDALADWVVAHTDNGVSDLLILCGQFPDTIYPGGNAQPDGSLAELFLDAGNCIINTGDYLFYVNSAGTNNAEGGIREMMDIPGIAMWDDNTPVALTVEGNAVVQSLQDFQTDRPFHLNELEGDWVPELILAQNAAGTRADPVIVVNTATGGRLGIFYQTASQDDDPRGEVMSEWINNWYLTGGEIPNSSAIRPVPEDGAKNVAIDTDLSWLVGIGAWSHDVYFGTEIPPAFVGNVNVNKTSFDPGILEYGTTYYWQVDEVDEDGTVRPSALWSFTTTTPVGIFEFTRDIGNPAGIGRTTYEGYVWKSDQLSEQYLLMGGGHDVWDNADDFHYAYNTVSGDVRVSANFEWIVKSNDWAKYGVMLRNTTDAGSVHRFMAGRGLGDYAGVQGRTSTNGGSSEMGEAWTSGAVAFAIQRVTVEGLTVIEGLADFGDGEGWVSRNVELVLDGSFNDELLAGVAITSHDDTHLAQARCWNVEYELNPSLVGELSLPTVPATADLGAATSDVSGFSIRSLAPLVIDGWGYDAMNELLDTGTWMGLPAIPGSEGTRIDEFVNLRDTGNGVFSVDNGYPDKSYPGIDPLEDPAQDPAAGDDDDNFATEILGCIQLTAGLHQIGASSDDGTIIEIGGVEIGRTGEWKGTSNEDFIYQVEADGYYNLRARTLEGGGGASIELHEIFLDGTRILLNDVANGGSAVFAPAP